MHCARTVDYKLLEYMLDEYVRVGLVSEKKSGSYSLFCYTQKTTFDRAWNVWTEMARGLIIDRKARKIVATPFEKFFNFGERPDAEPKKLEGFETYEKMDGSLIIVWYDFETEDWRCCTKGSFDSDQAKAAKELIGSSFNGVTEWTYLFELVGPSNRIVVPYERDELVLLGVFTEDGNELLLDELIEEAADLRVNLVDSHSYDSLEDLVNDAASLPQHREGFVIRFPDGYRLKIKGDEYKRIHRLISSCTPLAIWDMLAHGEDVSLVRFQMPEEYWEDFDTIEALITNRVMRILHEVVETSEVTCVYSDKELGLRLHTFPEPVRSMLFPYRKGTDLLKSKQIWKCVRPTGNVLPGYEPSYSINRAREELL